MFPSALRVPKERKALPVKRATPVKKEIRAAKGLPDLRDLPALLPQWRSALFLPGIPRL